MDDAKPTSLVGVKVKVWRGLSCKPSNTALLHPQDSVRSPRQKQRPRREPKALDTISTEPTPATPNRGTSSSPPGMFGHLDSTCGRAFRSHISLDASFFCSFKWRRKAPDNHKTSAAGALSSGRHRPPNVRKSCCLAEVAASSPPRLRLLLPGLWAFRALPAAVRYRPGTR